MQMIENETQWKKMYSALQSMKHRLPESDGSGVNFYHKLCCIIEHELQVIFRFSIKV